MVRVKVEGTSLADVEVKEVVQTDPHADLNAAAAKLIAMLPANVRDLLVETAVTTLKIPLWQLIAGIVQQGYDMGTFTSPVLNRDWVKEMPVMPSNYAVTVCEYCGKPFQPEWPKQRFGSGPEHDNCGAKFERARLANQRPSHVVGGKHALGEEPRGSVSSAVRPE